MGNSNLNLSKLKLIGKCSAVQVPETSPAALQAQLSVPSNYVPTLVPKVGRYVALRRTQPYLFTHAYLVEGTNRWPLFYEASLHCCRGYLHTP